MCSRESFIGAWIDPWLCTSVDKTLVVIWGPQTCSGVSWYGTRNFLVKYQDEMMCDILLSWDGPWDLGAIKKDMITSLTFLLCWDDKIL
jgi:hypothetical protein